MAENNQNTPQDPDINTEPERYEYITDSEDIKPEFQAILNEQENKNK